MKGLGRYSYEDFRYGMPPRAFGTETEFTHSDRVMDVLRYKRVDGDPLTLIDLVDPEYLVSPGRKSQGGIIFTTGGELYRDGTLEYATPECENPYQLVAHERAGEQLVFDTITRIAIAGGMPEQKVYKRNGYAPALVGTKRFKINSTGYHENYTSIFSRTVSDETNNIPREKKAYDAKCLSDFLALRTLIHGTGMIANDHFSLTQKPSIINYNYYAHSYSMGPNASKKRPFDTKSSRFEVRSSEASKSDWSTEFALGLTSLALRLVEHDRYPEHLLLADANIAVPNIARDPFAFVILKSGISMRAVDVLKGIVDEAYELSNVYPDFPSYEAKAADDFMDFYADLHRISLPENDVAALKNRINWAARFDYFRRLGIGYGEFDGSDPQQLSYDLVWDRIGESKDIARRILCKLGLTALSIPIPDAPATRAKTRVEIASRLYKEKNLKEVKWHEVVPFNGEPYLLGGPLNTQAIRPSDLHS